APPRRLGARGARLPRVLHQQGRVVASGRRSPVGPAHRRPAVYAGGGLRRDRRRGAAVALEPASRRGCQERGQGVPRARWVATVAGAAPRAAGAFVIAELSFYGALAVIVWVYVGYPVVLGVVATLRRRPVDRRAVRPQVSLIICAYNEERDIRRKLEETLACDYPLDRLRVI